MNKKRTSICPLCSGKVTKGSTTFTVELGTGVVVIRHVPAEVCTQCGANWIEDKTSKKIEKIILNARKKQLTVEVTSF